MVLDRLAVPDDLIVVVFLPHLLLEIDLFQCQAVLHLGHLAKRVRRLGQKRHEARRNPGYNERESFLYIRPLGMAVFLISRSLLTIDQLPKEEVPFPIEMLRAAHTGA